jgi:hypothetical protein
MMWKVRAFPMPLDGGMQDFEMEEEALKDPVLRRAETAGLQNHCQ